VRQIPTDSTRFWAALRLHIISLAYDVVVLHEPPDRLAWLLCAVRWLTPWRKPKLVLIGVIFIKPKSGVREQVKRLIKRSLLKQVDLYMTFMKYAEALRRYYGIGHGKYRYVPFKVNPPARARACSSTSEGKYVFTGGSSRRDFRTFCLAMKQLGYRGVILTPRAEQAAYHETFLDDLAVPENVRVIHDDGSAESWIEWLQGAKIVVVSVTSDSISPSGVSTYLDGMGLGKCVVVTNSLAVRDILDDGNQALVVPEGNPAALAEAIRRAWEDEALRRAIAERGKAYALSLGGEVELVQRFVNAVAVHFGWSKD